MQFLCVACSKSIPNLVVEKCSRAFIDEVEGICKVFMKGEAPVSVAYDPQSG